MSETLTEDFTLGYTGAFWDYGTLPIPCGTNPFRIHVKVLEALERKGLIGYLAIWFFDDQPPMPDLKEAQFFFPIGVPKDESERAKRMIKDIVLFALDNSLCHDELGNVMVVSNTISQEPELISVLKALELRNHNVLLVQSDRAKKADFPTLSLDWLFITLLNDDDDDAVMDGDYGDKVGDEAITKRKNYFAERKRALRERRIAFAKRKNALAKEKNALARGKVVKATTGVFWDVSDCPLPEGFSARSVYFSIKYSSKVHDYGDMSVFTYGNSKNTMPSEYSVETPFSLGGNIVHAHAGDKESRVYKMMWDILLWAFDNHQTSGLNLVVILSSEDKEFVRTYAYIEFVDTLLELKAKGYNVLLVQPEIESAASKDLLGSVSSIWLWTSLLQHFNSAKDVENLY
ncbi:hypothetical protein Rs2_32479 [Raphanus sativus]|nr:hypothetical protein Rs2_32479 [Raphanus sativus]